MKILNLPPTEIAGLVIFGPDLKGNQWVFISPYKTHIRGGVCELGGGWLTSHKSNNSRSKAVKVYLKNLKKKTFDASRLGFV